MSPITLEKPTFTKDQLVSATTASKEFSSLRKRAKKSPQYISDRNGIDSVLLDYDAYESMYAELQYLRELQLDQIAAERIAAADSDQNHKPILFSDALDDDELQAFLAASADDIADEDLFE